MHCGVQLWCAAGVDIGGWNHECDSLASPGIDGASSLPAASTSDVRMYVCTFAAKLKTFLFSAVSAHENF